MENPLEKDGTKQGEMDNRNISSFLGRDVGKFNGETIVKQIKMQTVNIFIDTEESA